MKLNRNKAIVILLIVALLIVKLPSLLSPEHKSSNVDELRKIESTGGLILTKHARCRMECRDITSAEIKEILMSGNENYSKSGSGTRDDQTYAIEGVSSDGQHIRIIVAPKNNKIVVITCIDLEREWPCNCN